MQLTVGMIGAFDKKGEDYAFLYKELERQGCKVVAIDTSIFASKVPFKVDVSPRELLGDKLDEVRKKKERPAAVSAMKEALKLKIEGICQKYGIVALVGGGGTNGTEIVTTAMQQVAKDMPKVCISTVTQHENWEYTKTANIQLIDPTVDFGGVNDISRKRYRTAALITATLAKDHLNSLHEAPPTPKLPAIGISMFGNTTKCVERCTELFRSRNYQVMPFHAVGTGGKNMEELVRDGTIRAGVLDLTLQEVPASFMGGIYSAGEERLSAPGETKTPHVVVPGCVDMVMLGKIEDAKKRFRGRRLYKCNANLTALRTNVSENRKSAHFIAKKVNTAHLNGSPVAVLIPAKGFSMFDEELEKWHDPKANKALIDTLIKELAPGVSVKVVDAFINDAAFADAASDMLLQLIDQQK